MISRRMSWPRAPGRHPAGIRDFTGWKHAPCSPPPGRCATYLPPVRLYLVSSVIFFLVASLSHSHGNVAELKDGHIQVVTSEAPCNDIQIDLFENHVWQQRLRHGCEAVVRDSGAGLIHVAAGAMAKAMFVFLPLLAFLHKLMYWRPRHRYAEHLLFFLHVHAFFFSPSSVVPGPARPNYGASFRDYFGGCLCIRSSP
jgi:hypothetical protein